MLNCNHPCSRSRERFANTSSHMSSVSQMEQTPFRNMITGIDPIIQVSATSTQPSCELAVKSGLKPTLCHVRTCLPESGLAPMTDDPHAVRRVNTFGLALALNKEQIGFAYAEGVNEDILFPASNSDAARRIIYPNESLQVFAQMYSLEWGQLADAVNKASCKTLPRRITITLRYTDWWNWEVNAPLRISNSWSQEFEAPGSVEEIVLEFETRNGKKPELDALISNQVSGWKFRTNTGVDLLLYGKPKEEFWVGSSKPGGTTYEHHSELVNGSRVMGNDEMLYYNVKLRWRRAT